MTKPLVHPAALVLAVAMLLAAVMLLIDGGYVAPWSPIGKATAVENLSPVERPALDLPAPPPGYEYDTFEDGSVGFVEA